MNGLEVEPRICDCVTVLEVDLVGFTKMASKLSPLQVFASYRVVTLI